MFGGDDQSDESAFDDLVGVDAGGLGDEAARQHLLGLHRARNRMDAAMVDAAGGVGSSGVAPC